MNLANIKKSGERQALLNEADIIRSRTIEMEAQYKWYEAESLAKDLQTIYAELLAMSKAK